MGLPPQAFGLLAQSLSRVLVGGPLGLRQLKQERDAEAVTMTDAFPRARAHGAGPRDHAQLVVGGWDRHGASSRTSHPGNPEAGEGQEAAGLVLPRGLLGSGDVWKSLGGLAGRSRGPLVSLHRLPTSTLPGWRGLTAMPPSAVSSRGPPTRTANARTGEIKTTRHGQEEGRRRHEFITDTV